jgi:RimJ/RimL family protein N-acetyltransferase
MHDDPDQLRLTTPRLTIVASTIALAEAELTNRRHLERMLGGALAADWPPSLNGPETVRYVLKKLRSEPAHAGWWSWYVLRRPDDSAGERTIIGVVGFKGAPDGQGTVEIGYAIVESQQRQGCASEAVTALVDWALARSGVQRIVAETLQWHTPSIRVLERNGFRQLGMAAEDGVARYVRECE